MPRKKATKAAVTPLAEGAKKYLDKDGLAYLITKNDTRYVRQEEGKGLSSNDFSDEYRKIVDDLNYKKIAIDSLTATNSSNEMGATVTDTDVSWTLNKEPKTQKIKFSSEAEEELETEARSKSYTGKSVTSNAIIKLTVTDERDASVSKQITISFQPKVYWGVSDKASLESADILELASNALAGNRNRTFSVNAAAGEYIYYAIPSSFGTPIFNVGGFDGGFVKAGTVNHKNASGYTQNYDVWKSVNAGLGQTSVTVK